MMTTTALPSSGANPSPLDDSMPTDGEVAAAENETKAADLDEESYNTLMEGLEKVEDLVSGDESLESEVEDLEALIEEEAEDHGVEVEADEEAGADAESDSSDSDSSDHDNNCGCGC